MQFGFSAFPMASLSRSGRAQISRPPANRIGAETSIALCDRLPPAISEVYVPPGDCPSADRSRIIRAVKRSSLPLTEAETSIAPRNRLPAGYIRGICAAGRSSSRRLNPGPLSPLLPARSPGRSTRRRPSESEGPGERASSPSASLTASP